MSDDHLIRVKGDDWRAALDDIRPRREKPTWATLTDAQREFLEYARLQAPPVPWTDLAPAFKSRYGWGNDKALAAIWKQREAE